MSASEEIGAEAVGWTQLQERPLPAITTAETEGAQDMWRYMAAVSGFAVAALAIGLYCF